MKERDRLVSERVIRRNYKSARVKVAERGEGNGTT